MVNYNIENEIIDKHRVITKEYRNNILIKSYHTFDGVLFHPSQPADIEYYQNGNLDVYERGKIKIKGGEFNE